MYISDGDFIKDIEVNDLRNRYLLTKGSTQKMVNDSIDVGGRGAAISTGRGHGRNIGMLNTSACLKLRCDLSSGGGY